MTASLKERVGVLVIRAWTAGPSPQSQIRARMTSTLDLDSPSRKVSAAASMDDVMETVRRWLESFMAS